MGLGWLQEGRRRFLWIPKFSLFNWWIYKSMDLSKLMELYATKWILIERKLFLFLLAHRPVIGKSLNSFTHLRNHYQRRFFLSLKSIFKANSKFSFGHSVQLCMKKDENTYREIIISENGRNSGSRSDSSKHRF